MLHHLLARLRKLLAAIQKKVKQDGPPHPLIDWEELPEDHWPDWYREKVRKEREKG